MDDTRGGLTRTPHKLNERGEWVPFPKREENSASNLEEAATVAESLVRIQSPSAGVNGYYSRTRHTGTRHVRGTITIGERSHLRNP